MTPSRLVKAALGVTLLAMMIAVSAQATPSPGTRRSSIVFWSTRAGSQDIYTVRADGSGLTRLTGGVAGPNQHPRWSPNGRRIAFSSKRDSNWEIYTMNADGTAQTRLTTNPARDTSPAWTAHGRRIVFERDAFGSSEIYSVGVSGGSEIDLTNNPADDFTPATSRSGDRIAFASNRSGNGAQIYTMRGDGSRLRQVTFGSAFDFNPSWSPGDREIAFLRDTTGTDNDIYVVRANGSGLTRLTTTPDRIEFGPSWSPDGRRIIFSGCSIGCHLYTINRFGGQERQLTRAVFGPPVKPPYAEDFDNNAFNPAFWQSFGPVGAGMPAPTLRATNGRLEFSYPADAVADPDLGFAAVQMVSRCLLTGDFDFQMDFRLLDWPPANGVTLALGAESVNTQAAMSLGRLSDPTERYGGFSRLADGSITFGDLATTDQQGSLRLVRSGATAIASVLISGSWVPIVSAPAASDELQITLTASTQDNIFGHQPVRAAFDNFRLNAGSFDPAACVELSDFDPDWRRARSGSMR